MSRRTKFSWLDGELSIISYATAFVLHFQGFFGCLSIIAQTERCLGFWFSCLLIYCSASSIVWQRCGAWARFGAVPMLHRLQFMSYIWMWVLCEVMHLERCMKNYENLLPKGSCFCLAATVTQWLRSYECASSLVTLSSSPVAIHQAAQADV